MRITLLAFGQKMPKWVDSACAEYQQRMPSNMGVTIESLPLEKRGKKANLNRIQQLESAAMLAKIPDNEHVVALEISGKPWSTEQLACQLEHWQGLGKNITILIGGPEGLNQQCLDRADQSWSLSTLTFPHPLVRVIVCEQLFRSWSILNNHPYHRGDST